MGLIEMQRPDEYDAEDLEEFIDFAFRHGHVPNKMHLTRGVKSARLLLREIEDDILIGVAAVKCPTIQHTKNSFCAAGSNLDEALFRLELGYVATHPKYLRRGIASKLATVGLGQFAGQPIYATMRADNLEMQGLLGKFFVREGQEYPSAEGDYRLVLYVRQ